MPFQNAFQKLFGVETFPSAVKDFIQPFSGMQIEIFAGAGSGEIGGKYLGRCRVIHPHWAGMRLIFNTPFCLPSDPN
ncbi:hypothetical protein FBQ95_07620 [Chloroflexi bacterium CFX3]|nr:hypothetical protein [Chloroflexi bacterium CFX3]